MAYVLLDSSVFMFTLVLQSRNGAKVNAVQKLPIVGYICKSCECNKVVITDI